MFVKRKQTSKQTKQFKQTPAAGSMFDVRCSMLDARCSMLDARRSCRWSAMFDARSNSQLTYPEKSLVVY
tara:strand:- start:375 stop:584 length:210 start_codon:yes stop_codon:yes gene_type:complete